MLLPFHCILYPPKVGMQFDISFDTFNYTVYIYKVTFSKRAGGEYGTTDPH